MTARSSRNVEFIIYFFVNNDSSLVYFHRDLSNPHFPLFALNTEISSVKLELSPNMGNTNRIKL